MKAMILAAGLGTRMRPLTNQHPKPLLQAGGKYLIDYHLDKLAHANIKNIIINTHWLAEQMPQALGDGSNRGLTLRYAYEPQLLETAGGIKNVLADLSSNDDAPFLVINGDIYTELDLPLWLETHRPLMRTAKAYLAFVPNPTHNPQGDFCLDLNDGSVFLNDYQAGTSTPASTSTKSLTYSGVALFRPSFFDDVPAGPQALGPILKTAILKHQVRGGVLDGYWLDIGTPERLDQLIQRLA